MKKTLLTVGLCIVILLFGRWLNDAGASSGDGSAGGAACASIAGDLNGDSRRDISDAVFLLSHLFLGGPAPVAFCQGGGCDLEAKDCITLQKFFLSGDLLVPNQVAVGDKALLRRTESGTDGADFTLRDSAGTLTMNMDTEEIGGGAIIRMTNDAGIETVKIDADQVDAAAVELKKADGTLGILLDANNPIGGSLISTQVLKITGGADVAEPFDVEGGAAPGMVVAIDPARPGKLRLATEPNDRKVAGIVSGAGGVRPGLVMGQAGTSADGELSVALTGRVYCWCDAANGPIEPGDFLTSSATPGYAMRATDLEASRGAILGKAMTGLKDGRGLVLVLVGLQ